jgi:tRNA pseudouridine55 synthase
MSRGRRQRGQPTPSGILVIDKPPGLTSFGVVRRVRAICDVRKAGHTGTLDPLATGVLPICLNEATKIAGLLLAEDKRYVAELQLGLRTDTYDITGKLLEQRDAEAAAVTELAVERALIAFRGQVQQRPPAFSALHKDGKRAHELARAGEQVELPERSVTFHQLELEAFDAAERKVTLAIHCSKGTYVRSLCEDLGRALGCGATMTQLRRLQSGSFTLERAIELDALEQLAQPDADDPDAGRERWPLITLDTALSHLPAVDLPDREAVRAVGQGRALDLCSLDIAELPAGDELRVRFEGRVIALGAERDGNLAPHRVFGSCLEESLG